VTQVACLFGRDRQPIAMPNSRVGASWFSRGFRWAGETWSACGLMTVFSQSCGRCRSVPRFFRETEAFTMPRAALLATEPLGCGSPVLGAPTSKLEFGVLQASGLNAEPARWALPCLGHTEFPIPLSTRAYPPDDRPNNLRTTLLSRILELFFLRLVRVTGWRSVRLDGVIRLCPCFLKTPGSIAGARGCGNAPAGPIAEAAGRNQRRGHASDPRSNRKLGKSDGRNSAKPCRCPALLGADGSCSRSFATCRGSPFADVPYLN